MSSWEATRNERHKSHHPPACQPSTQLFPLTASPRRPLRLNVALRSQSG